MMQLRDIILALINLKKKQPSMTLLQSNVTLHVTVGYLLQTHTVWSCRLLNTSFQSSDFLFLHCIQSAKEEKRRFKDRQEKGSQKAVYNHELSDN